MVLTERQRKELLSAMLEFLSLEPNNQFAETVECFKREAGGIDTSDFGKNLLEKKWTSVVRLQKRVMDLEAQVSELQKSARNNDSDSPMKRSDNRDNKLSLPRGPAKYSMSGHRGPITALVVHPVFSIVASGSEDCSIKLWDFETAQYERTLKGHTGPVTGLAFNKNGSLLASCSNDLSAKLWDMNSFVCVKTLKGHDHQVSAIKILSSDDFLLTCSRDNTIKLWEINTGYCTKTFVGHSEWVRTIDVAPDGAYFASGGMDQSILVWKISTGQQIVALQGHEHVVETLCFGKKPFNALDMVVSQVDSASEMAVDTPDDSDMKKNESYYLASGSRDRTIRLWEPLQGICLMVINCHENWVRSLVFHPSGKYLLSCGDDKTLRIIDVKEGKCMRTIQDAHAHFVTCIGWNANHGTVVSGSVDKNLNVWACH